MKYALQITRYIVGVLFIFSGLVKANDPLGLSYKMKEFFEIWNIDLGKTPGAVNRFLINFFQFWHDHSLSLSIFIIALEIILGVAVLIGWRMKMVSWLLLLLIVFFTFLTGYAYLSKNPGGSPKFTNCGCFGDCLPISSKTSFIKDLVLTALIGFLFYYRNRIKPSFSKRTSFVIMSLTTLCSFLLQWYVLTYLPLVDCLPYKKGNNISEKMKPPPGAIQDSFAIRFVYEKQGKEYEFPATDLPADLKTYTFKKRFDKLVRKGNADPPIKGFSLRTVSGIDSTEIVLSQPYAFLLFCENFSTPVKAWQKDFQTVRNEAASRNIPVYIVTASSNEASKALASTPFSDLQIFETDFTAIRTAARTNPSLYLLKQGTVVNKWSYKNISSATKFLPAK